MGLIFPLSSSQWLTNRKCDFYICSTSLTLLGTIWKPSLMADHNTIKLEINNQRIANVAKVVSALGNLIRFPLGIIFRPLLSTL